MDKRSEGRESRPLNTLGKTDQRPQPRQHSRGAFAAPNILELEGEPDSDKHDKEILRKTTALNSKGNRPAVQTSILRDQKNNMNLNSGTRKLEKQNKIKAEGMSRQAAAENEHVAVRRSNGGRDNHEANENTGALIHSIKG